MELIGKSISHYRILEKPGSSGMGRIYKAEDTRLKRMITLILLYYFLIMAPLFAQNRDIHITGTDCPPEIDGNLDDPVWQTCEKYGDFIQFDPFNGEPLTENTTVMLAFDEDNLYIAFQCDDSEPQKIAAFLTPREQFDTGMDSDDDDDESEGGSSNDCVTLILDTFRDRRTSYSFTVNPRGVQKDEPGDYLWQSGAQITPDGWQAELRIPFKSIRFSKDEAQSWGINFKRYIFRLKETDYFTRVGRDDILLDKSALLSGLEGISGGKNLEIFPYAGFRSSQSEGQTEKKFAGGLDVKYSITSDLNLDVTASPDFSEVESDPFFYQLTPYEFELQEKRPFFQEGSQYFPTAGHNYSLFYSKRITNPKVAGKLTGRQGKYTLGAIGALNKEQTGDGTIGAFSVQRDIFRFSKIGVMASGYSNRDFKNVNGGFGYDIKFTEIFSWSGTVMASHNSDLPDSQNKSISTEINYQPDVGFGGFMRFDRLEKYFQPRAGIWRETDLQSFMIHPGYSIRMNKGGIKQIAMEGYYELRQTAGGTPLGYTVRLLEAKLSTLKNHSVEIEVRLGRTRVQLEEEGSLHWSGTYFQERSVLFGTSYQGSRFYQFGLEYQYSKTPVYNSEFSEAYDGRSSEFKCSLFLLPTSTIRLMAETEYTKQSRQYDGSTLFEGMLSTMGLNWQITRSVFFSTDIQHDSYEKRMKIDLLFGIELGMGKMLSISYKSRGPMPLKKVVTGDEASTLLIKASYLFRI